MRRGIFLSVVLMLSSVLWAKEQDSDTIKIGVVGPITGPSANFGDQMLHGAKQAINDINASGGINGKKLEMVAVDDACDPKQAVTAANRLINEDKVKWVVGHFCSACTIPASSIYADAEVFMITPASTNPIITERKFPTIFRMCGRDDQQGTVAANFIHDKIQAKRVAVIHDKDSYGKGLADATLKTLKSLGTPIVLYEGLTRGEKDFSALVTKIKAANVDCIYFGGLHMEAGTLIRELREQNMSTAFVVGDGVASSDFVTIAGGPQVVDGIYMTFGADPRQSKEAQKVVESFRKEGYEPEGYTLYTYASIQALGEALKQIKEENVPKVVEWLHQHPVATVLGEEAWDEKGDLKNSNFIMYRWNKDGKYEPYYWSTAH